MPTHVLDSDYTVEDMAEAIRAAYAATLDPADEADTITRSEVEEVLGCGRHQARLVIKRLVSAGRLEADRVWRVLPHGYRQRMIGYRWVTPPV